MGLQVCVNVAREGAANAIKSLPASRAGLGSSAAAAGNILRHVKTRAPHACATRLSHAAHHRCCCPAGDGALPAPRGHHCVRLRSAQLHAGRLAEWPGQLGGLKASWVLWLLEGRGEDVLLPGLKP